MEKDELSTLRLGQTIDELGGGELKTILQLFQQINELRNRCRNTTPSKKLCTKCEEIIIIEAELERKIQQL